jgi:hypothetical protein
MFRTSLMMTCFAASLLGCVQAGDFCEVQPRPFNLDPDTAKVVLATDRTDLQMMLVNNAYGREVCEDWPE